MGGELRNEGYYKEGSTEQITVKNLACLEGKHVVVAFYAMNLMNDITHDLI